MSKGDKACKPRQYVYPVCSNYGYPDHDGKKCGMPETERGKGSQKNQKGDQQISSEFGGKNGLVLPVGTFLISTKFRHLISPLYPFYFFSHNKSS